MSYGHPRFKKVALLPTLDFVGRLGEIPLGEIAVVRWDRKITPIYGTVYTKYTVRYTYLTVLAVLELSDIRYRCKQEQNIIPQYAITNTMIIHNMFGDGHYAHPQSIFPYIL